MEEDFAHWESASEDEPFSLPIHESVLGATEPPAELFRPLDDSGTLIVRNLLNDLSELAYLLKQAIDQAAWLNAFLLAAGMWQIIEDYLHSDPFSLQRAEKAFEDLQHPVISLPRTTIRLARIAVTGLFQRNREYKQVLAWNTSWASFVQDLAEAAIEKQPIPVEDQAKIRERSSELLSKVDTFPARLKRSILRLPNCFRSFDQRPKDIERMVAKFARQYPDQQQPVVMIGLRTSGSYLAPFFQSYLKKAGYQDVIAMTLRPGVDLLSGEKSVLKRALEKKALFVLVDDPPVSGSSLLRAAKSLESLRVPSQFILLMVPLFSGSDTLPEKLRSYQHILLPWLEWSIHDLTSTQAVKKALAGWLLPGLEISHLERDPFSQDDIVRGHITSLYRMVVTEPNTGQTWQQEVFVKGNGLGYFGEHVLDMVRNLSPYFPRVYGLQAGLLFRAWSPEQDNIGNLSELTLPGAAQAMVTYLWERHLKLRVAEDTSLRRFGESPAWEVASDLLSHVYGRARKLVRVPLIDPLMRRLMQAAEPSIVDGNSSLSNWFYQPSLNQVKKVAFERGVFRNDIEYTSYDPAFDLGSLSADLDMAALGGKGWAERLNAFIRPIYEELLGSPLDEERWLLYQLVRLSEVQRIIPSQRAHLVKRAFSRALQRYFSRHYFRDLTANEEGEFCAFDLDGVLETNYLGSPALSPASAGSLRSLAQHGYRSILVTGRSLPEVSERCSLYPLSGGVAEYGAAIYLPKEKTARVLLSKAEQDVLVDLRKFFQLHASIFVDPDYQYAVRAYRIDTAGRRVGLAPDQIEEALQSCSPEREAIRAIPGEAQTDFMVERVDKAVGIRALLAELSSDEVKPSDSRPLALAVGDSLSDLPMLQLAQRAAIPAHADQSLSQPGIHRYTKAYQAGLSMAVNDLLKHSSLPWSQPRCQQCQDPKLSQDARQLLKLFSVQENGWKSMIASFFHRI